MVCLERFSYLFYLTTLLVIHIIILTSKVVNAWLFVSQMSQAASTVDGTEALAPGFFNTTSAELEDYMNEEMTPDYMTGTPNTVCADARRQFSRIGLMFLIGTVLIYGVQFGASGIANAINPDLLSSTSYALLIVMIPMYVIAMPVMALLIKRIPAVTLPKKHMTFGQWLIAFLMCYGAMYVSNYTGLILTQLISILKGSPVTNTMLEVATSSNLWVNLFIMVLCAPVAEELIFRKLLIDRLAQYGEGVAVLFSGLMFGLFHGNLNQFVYAFVLGLCFGFIYVKTGNIRYTIGLHMLVNFLGSVLGVAILKWLGDDFLSIASDPAGMMSYMTGNFGKLIVYFIYIFLLLGVAIAGIILFIVNLKKIRFLPGMNTLPKGKRFSTTVLNVGMALYMIVWIVIIIVQLFQ